ncbi:Rdx family protein [Bacillus tamaricis]|uniref:Rdx family protein n=1 Tax=Evansella tamaricis TaxID=2069301 RepID=A0ABS6JFD8_9BACI|nr:Rdx family protein [Evansella tamaricis]
MFNHFRSEIENLNLVASSGGAFEVYVNGEKIHSKLDTGEYPQLETIINKMKSLK